MSSPEAIRVPGLYYVRFEEGPRCIIQRPLPTSKTARNSGVGFWGVARERGLMAPLLTRRAGYPPRCLDAQLHTRQRSRPCGRGSQVIRQLARPVGMLQQRHNKRWIGATDSTPNRYRTPWNDATRYRGTPIA
jgi:hypothetical protein